jgi:hypothetical protein
LSQFYNLVDSIFLVEFTVSKQLESQSDIKLGQNTFKVLFKIVIPWGKGLVLNDNDGKVVNNDVFGAIL